MADFYGSITDTLTNSAQNGDAAPDNVAPIGPEQLKKFTQALLNYKADRSAVSDRIIAAEEWWRLRNTAQEQKKTEIGKDGGFVARSSWLHNVIVSKHADAMDAYPEPIILPREANDKPEAHKLTSILPCVFDQNKFKMSYRDVQWRKLKGGTGFYKVIWDSSKLYGMGDISIISINPLNLYFQPNITDIQQSKYVFQVEKADKDMLKEKYPQLADRLKTATFAMDEFRDTKNDSDTEAVVIECYYKKSVNGVQTLQYVKYIEDVVLEATENDPDLSQTGLYNHGKYPFVADTLFPIENSIYGYGFVDIEQNPQTIIDLLRTAFVKNATVGSIPRYFSRANGNVNISEFLDTSNPIVNVQGSFDDNSLRQITTPQLPGAYINVLDGTIEELRQTSGNTETATGNSSAGVTAAAAIAALQEASGKGSRDSTDASYDAYKDVVELVIELIRQFYDLPRQFRIIGQYGMEDFITYDNSGIKPVPQGDAFGVQLGDRTPLFDITIKAAKASAYTKMAQNELALQFYSAGFFNPQNVDQAAACIEMMDFEGKDEVLQKITRNGTIFDKLVQYMQMALMLATKYEPALVNGLANDISMTVGGQQIQNAGASLPSGGQLAGQQSQQSTIINNAKQRTAEASQPREGR